MTGNEEMEVNEEQQTDDEFAAAFDEELGDDQESSAASDETGDTAGDADDAGSTDEEDGGQAQAGADSTEETPPDYKALYEQEQAKARESEQRYNTLQGKYNAEVERARQQQQSGQTQQQQQPQEPQRPSDDGYDEAEKAELADFRKKNPELAKATIDGPKSETFRKILLNRGAEDVAYYHDLMPAPQEQGPVEDTALREEFVKREISRHESEIASTHPDWKETLFEAEPLAQGQRTVKKEIFDWINRLPFIMGRDALYVLKKGNSNQVSNLLQAYKDFKAQRDDPTKGGGQEQQSASTEEEDAAAPVKGRSPGIPTQGIAADDFDGAFEAATRPRR